MKLNIYMKSGNVVPLHGVKKFDLKVQGDTLVSISVEFGWWQVNVLKRERLLITSLNLSQVEAVTRVG